jgi:uncharacterized PurR-regulated membrane protein YhhQ (DUF165 family)
MISTAYETTVLRVGLALWVGAVVGTCFIVIAMVAPAVVYPTHSGAVDSFLRLVALIALVSFMCFSVGLAFIGAPAWWLLHRFGRRSWLDALLLGFFLTFVCTVLLLAQDSLWPTPGSNFQASDSGGATVINNRLTAHGWANIIKMAALVAVAGGGAALAMWRVAYRKRPML